VSLSLYLLLSLRVFTIKHPRGFFFTTLRYRSRTQFLIESQVFNLWELRWVVVSDWNNKSDHFALGNFSSLWANNSLIATCSLVYTQIKIVFINDGTTLPNKAVLVLVRVNFLTSGG
jgi:hypothetical protein